MYARFIARGIAAMEWLDRDACLLYLARTNGWDVEGYPRCPRRPPLGVGTCRVLEGSPDGELLGSPVHHQGGGAVCRGMYPSPFQGGSAINRRWGPPSTLVRLSFSGESVSGHGFWDPTPL